MMTKDLLLASSLLIAVLACPLSLRGGVPDSVATEEVPTAKAILQHVKDIGSLTSAERMTLRSWLTSENPMLQALGAWLLARLPGDATELDEELARRSRTYGEVANGFAKVAAVQRAMRGQSRQQRADALVALMQDTNPFVSFEALRAVADIDAAQAVSKARDLYQDASHPLRPYVAEFLRKHGENVPPQPLPGSVYKTLIDITSRL